MTVKEYLEQAVRLDERIREEKLECQRLRELAQGLRSPSLQGRVDGTKNPEATFVRELEKLAAEEERMEKNIKTMVALKIQTGQVLGQVKDPLTRGAFRLHYLYGKPWGEIGAYYHMSETGIKKRCRVARAKIILPPDAVELSAGIPADGFAAGARDGQ